VAFGGVAARHDLQAGHDPRGRRFRQLWVPIPDDLGARVGAERSELRVADGDAIHGVGAMGEHRVRARHRSAGQQP
jgi:hypothetical protein